MIKFLKKMIKWKLNTKTIKVGWAFILIVWDVEAEASWGYRETLTQKDKNI